MDKVNEIVVYQPDEIVNLEVRVENESVWLTLNQIAILFDRDKSVISRHINNVYKEKELSKISTVAKIATVQIENGRSIVHSFLSLPSKAPIHCLLSREIFCRLMSFGHSASQAYVLVQLPKPSSSILATMFFARSAAST